MKIRKSLFCKLLLGIMIATLSGYAQCDTLPIKIPERVFANTNEINLIYSQMVDSLLFISKSEYVLVSKSPSKIGQYGRMGKTYYGRKYDVGVWTDGKLWFNKNITKPWNNEESILAFADSLQPQISSLTYRALYNSDFTATNPNSIKPYGQSFLVVSHLQINKSGHWWKETDVQSTGRLVLLCNTGNESDSKLVIQKYFCKSIPTWIGHEAIIQKPNYIKGECMGGAFFYERLTAGSLQLYLGGIVESINETTLKLIRINEQQKINTDSADSTNR